MTLFAPPLPTVRSHLDALVPGWSTTQLALAGKYLGFYVGPDSRNLLWKDPEAKFRQRASLWANHPLGLH